MSRYTYAKQNLPDWDEHASQELKTRIKAICFKKAMYRVPYSETAEIVKKHIDEFVDEFNETEEQKAIGERYRTELTEFAREAWQMATAMLDKFQTPYMLAQALAPPEVLTKVQRDNLNRLVGARFVVPDQAAERLGEQLPSFTEGGARRATAGDTYYPEIHKEAKSLMRSCEDFRASATRPYLANVNQRNIVEMGIRFARYQEQKKQLIEKGVKVVYVPPHANCSRRCQPFQSRLYSLDGTRGSIDGRQYIPIEEVADNVTVRGKRDPSRVYAAGLFSYNCRHTMTEYEEGQNIEVIPDDVIERQRKIETEQREREREIRAMKEKYLLLRELRDASGDKNLQPELTALYKGYIAKGKEYRAFCSKHEIPRYDDRLKVITGEDLYKRTSGRKDSRVTNIDIPSPAKA